MRTHLHRYVAVLGVMGLVAVLGLTLGVSAAQARLNEGPTRLLASGAAHVPTLLAGHRVLSTGGGRTIATGQRALNAPGLPAPGHSWLAIGVGLGMAALLALAMLSPLYMGGRRERRQLALAPASGGVAPGPSEPSVGDKEPEQPRKAA